MMHLHTNMSVNSDHFHAIDLFVILTIFINFVEYSFQRRDEIICYCFLSCQCSQNVASIVYFLSLLK